MRYLVLLLQLLLICSTFAVNPKSDKFSDAYFNYLKKIQKDYQITGYNLYNFLGKNSPIDNQTKIKINNHFGINLQLLNTLEKIIQNKKYPSLFLSPNLSKTSQSNELNEQEINYTNINNYQPYYSQETEPTQYPYNEHGINNDNETDINNYQPYYSQETEPTQYPYNEHGINNDNEKEETKNNDGEKEEDSVEEEDSNNSEEDDENNDEANEIDDTESDISNEQQINPNTTELLLDLQDDEGDVEEDEDDDDEQQTYIQNQKFKNKNSEYQLLLENDEDANEENLGNNADYQEFEYENIKTPKDRDTLRNNLRRIKQAKNAMFGSLDDRDFYDENESTDNDEDYESIDSRYNDRNDKRNFYNNNTSELQLQSDYIQPDDPIDEYQYYDQPNQYQKNNEINPYNVPDSNQIQLESDITEQNMPNYINQNLNDQYLSVDKDIITNNNGSFQKANNGNYFQNTNYINNANRNLRDQNQPQLQLESDLLNTSESNYFPNYDSKMNSNFPNSFTKSMFINNNESTPINNVSLSNETSLIYTNPQNQFVNQERFVDTSNVSGNRQNFNPMSMPLPSIRNTAYQEIPLNPKLNQVMLNEPQSRNQAMKTFSNNFSTNIIPTHKQTLDSSPYLTTNNVPKITDLPRNQSGKKQKRTFSSKKKTNIHDLRNFLRESNTKVISSPDQEENNRHSYLYPTQTQSNSLSEELHINHF